jgi:hypothetical protein
LGNALVLVVFLDRHLDGVLFLHDAGEANYVPANAIAPAAPAKEICRRGDHKRGIRRTADQASAGCQYEVKGLGPASPTSENYKGSDMVDLPISNGTLVLECERADKLCAFKSSLEIPLRHLTGI